MTELFLSLEDADWLDAILNSLEINIFVRLK